MANEKISVIVPIYKVEEYLDRCVESIINQTYKNLEIILVDDGSPDNCPKMCDEWAKKDKRIKVVHKKNGGLSDARNAGLDKATGKFVGFVDSDDYIEPAMYETLYNKISKDKSDMAMCNITKVYSDRKVKVHEKNLLKVNASNIFEYYVTHNYSLQGDELLTDNIMASVWRVLYRTSSIGDLKFDNYFCEDIIFNSKLIKPSFKISAVEDYFYNYVQRGGSILSSLTEAKIKAKIEFIRVISSVLREKLSKLYFESYMFYLYKALYIEVLNTQNNALLKILQNDEFVNKLRTKTNYKSHNKLTTSFKTKLSSFLIYHKLYWVYKIIK